MRADRLKQIRERRGLSQRELALRCGIGEKQIWRYENSESEPTSGLLIKICRELSISSDYLLGLVENEDRYFTGTVFVAAENELISLYRQHKIKASLRIIENMIEDIRDMEFSDLSWRESPPDFEQYEDLEPYEPLDGE